FVDIDLPNTMIVDIAVVEDEETAMSAAQGMYYLLYSIGNFASGSPNSVSVIGGLAADELVPHNSVATSDFEFYQNEITLNNSANGAVWKSAYNTIYMANAIMEGVASSTSISDVVKQQLEGEARFVRAFAFFYLVNLYSDVPLVLTTDYRVNALLSRALEADIYAQIIADLEVSRTLL